MKFLLISLAVVAAFAAVSADVSHLDSATQGPNPQDIATPEPEYIDIDLPEPPRAKAAVHAPIHAPVRTQIHAPIHAPVHAPVHAPILAPIHAPVHTQYHAAPIAQHYQQAAQFVPTFNQYRAPEAFPAHQYGIDGYRYRAPIYKRYYRRA